MFISVAAQSHAAWPGPDSDAYTSAAASAIFPTWEQFNFSHLDLSQLISAPTLHSQALYEMPNGSACMPNRRAELRVKTQSRRPQQERQPSTHQQHRAIDLAVSNDGFYGTQLRSGDETFMPGDGYTVMASQNNYPSYPTYVSHQPPPLACSRKESHHPALPPPGFVEPDDFIKQEAPTQGYWSSPVPADLAFSSFAPEGAFTRWQPSFQELQDPNDTILGYHQYGLATTPHGLPQIPFEQQAAGQTMNLGNMPVEFRNYSNADSGSGSTFGSFSSTGASEMLESMVLSDEPTHISWPVSPTGNTSRDSMTTVTATGLPRGSYPSTSATWRPAPPTLQVPTVSPKLLRLRPSPTITPTSSSESILTAFFKGSRDGEQSGTPAEPVAVETEREPNSTAKNTPSARSTSSATSSSPAKLRKLLPSFESRRRQSPPIRSKDSASKANTNTRKPSRHHQSSHKPPSPPPIKRKTHKQKPKHPIVCDSLREVPEIAPPPPPPPSKSARKSLRLSTRSTPASSAPPPSETPAAVSAPILAPAPTQAPTTLVSPTASASITSTIPAPLAPLAPRPKKVLPATPLLTRFAPPKPPSAIVVAPVPDPIPRGFEDRAAADEYLIRSKKAGWTYKDIRRRGGFVEAESTLRGRYRTLTKSREQRVRKPAWSDKDLHLLEIAVRILAKPMSGCVAVEYPSASVGNGYGVPIPVADLNTARVPWKQVAEYIFSNGGSYRFGNSTCRKRWDRLAAEQVAAGKDLNRPFYEQPGKPILGDRKQEKGKKKSEKVEVEEEAEEAEYESDESESEDDDVEMD
ncbi:hypothetical protein B0H67DRAFT_303856 [Lasiosphaeris hirsuta]|uniref:Myb-like domain-containing protein n=1 Tax=Lasiosphaeris hirsuta TaxID=260670 RepID=A0AA40A9V1_9PEZI|nr:hypothetical protein B0H67DRAFT_303856 [Lasiosphaeris hirsuta]